MAIQTEHQLTTRRKREVKPAKTRAELLAEYNALPDNARLNEQMLAAVLLCSLAKLQRDRWSGGGIPFIREGGTSKADRNGRVQIFGGKVFYVKKDVEAHLASKQAITSTSAIDQAAIHRKKS